ncbi:MAG: hypothetical protein EBR40_09945 [Proteobacteria bacterium]|nr:hypothetical protein [Pseudomonadota bacterium]
MDSIYTWNWKTGGYNSCTARSLAEAKRKADVIGTPKAGMKVRLVPDPGSFRKVTTTEMAAIDRSWAAAFD